MKGKVRHKKVVPLIHTLTFPVSNFSSKKDTTVPGITKITNDIEVTNPDTDRVLSVTPLLT